MADIRIKDLATTATTTASDDFMAVDGSTNGTRKMNAAAPAFLTSVTTPSLTSPAASPLTLGTGTSGAAITVLSASNNVGIGTTSPAVRLNVADADNGANGTIQLGSSSIYGTIKNEASSTGKLALDSVGSGAAGGISLRVGGVVGLGINNVGTVSIASSTAGSAGAGALVVTGGLSAGNNGNASYFGGAVTAAVVTSTGAGYTNSGFQITNTSASRTTGLFLSNAGVTSIRDVTGAADLFTLSLTGAATFAGAVAIGNTVGVGVAVASTHKVTMVIGGVTYYLLASNV